MNLYAIYDKVSNDYVGGLFQVIAFAADAPATRYFGDALSDPNGLGRHADDYELHRIGQIAPTDDEPVLVGLEREVVVTGSAWRELQEAAKAAKEAR